MSLDECTCTGISKMKGWLFSGSVTNYNVND